MSVWKGYLLRENLFGVLMQLAGFASSLVFILLFPRLLGPDQFGLLSIVLGVSSLTLIPLEYGITSALNRLVPLNQGKNAWAYFKHLENLKLKLTIGTLVAFFMLAPFIATGIYGLPSLTWPMQLGALMIAAFSFSLFYANIFMTIKKTLYGLRVYFLNHAFRIVAPIALFALFRSYVDVITGFLLAGLIASAYAAYKLRFQAHRFFKSFASAKIDLKELRRYLKLGFFVNVNYVILQWLDIPVAALYLSPALIAFYKVAVSWSNIPSYLFPFNPSVITAAHAREKQKQSERVFYRSLQFSMLYAFLAVLGFFLLSKKFVSFVHGADYAEAGGLLVLLSWTSIAFAISTPSDAMLQGRGRIDYSAKVNGISTLAQVILLFVLTPLFGLVGLAAAVLLSKYLNALGLGILAAREFKLCIPLDFVWKPALAALACGLVLSPFVPLVHDAFFGAAFVAATVVIYSAIALLLRAFELDDFIRPLSGLLGKR